ncbi:MAG: hypothetical protein E7388_01635 [Ruminococcaceae bacterium]|nr:hypothetical protein [Oscillospiraceae bacterium]
MADNDNKDLNNTVEINPDDFNFGEKKVDKLVLSKNVIKYSLAAIFFILFVVNGVLMQLEVKYEQFPNLAFEYVDKIPAIVQILLMIGSLFTVSVIANLFGGKEEKEYHVKEDTKIKK